MGFILDGLDTESYDRTYSDRELIRRIVGYFSRVDNWNKSKLGELADRQKGNYAVV